MSLSPLLISLKVAMCATACTFVLGLAAARWVCASPKGRSLADGLFTLPMVLPPTVVGFFLLVLFGSNGWLGKLLAAMGLGIIFTWQGAVIAAVVVSFPLMYRTVRGALEQVEPELVYAGRTLGMSEAGIFFKIMLPVSWPGIMAGTILSFARALGEFGATIMLAGNIPGRTQTMSVAVYTAVQSGNRRLAYEWTAVIMVISLCTMLLMNYWTGRQERLVRRKR